MPRCGGEQFSTPRRAGYPASRALRQSACSSELAERKEEAERAEPDGDANSPTWCALASTSATIHPDTEWRTAAATIGPLLQSTRRPEYGQLSQLLLPRDEGLGNDGPMQPSSWLG